jgi:hypothetical protein
MDHVSTMRYYWKSVLCSPFPYTHGACFRERLVMKKIDVDADTKRSKFLIKAMLIQVVVVLVIMFAFWAYLAA